MKLATGLYILREIGFNMEIDREIGYIEKLMVYIYVHIANSSGNRFIDIGVPPVQPIHSLLLV